MNNKTTEKLINELLEINKKHISTLNERIKVLKHTIEIDKQTIKIQNDTINNYLKNKSNE